MLTIQGRAKSVCGGVSRRELLEAGGAGLLGLNLPQVLAAESAAPPRPARAKSVIFLFLFGGPSQLETFDLKPEAPEKIRGPFRPIPSRTPELRVCEHLGRCAAISDRFCVVRTMTHGYNDHSGAAHYIQTGHPWHIPIGGGFNATPQDWPAMGSIVEYRRQHAPRPGDLSASRSGADRHAPDGARIVPDSAHVPGGHRLLHDPPVADRQIAPTDKLPSYVVVPNFLGRIQTYSTQLVRPGQYAGWLGRGYDPLSTAIDKRNSKDNPYFRDCTDEELDFRINGMVSPEDVTLDRLDRRRSLLAQLDEQRRTLADAPAIAYDRFRQRALDLVTSETTRRALDIRREPAALRERYGRHLFGQSTLMARRLIEAGVRFVTVHWDAPDGYSWDSHRNSDDVRDHLLPGLDQALSALLVDLDERGLLDETLVVCLGEMGRTPQPNATWGRGHWSTLFPAVLAGAGIRGGIAYGESDKDAAHPVSHPTSPADLAATVYEALGIDPQLRVPDPQGRPVPLVETGRPLRALFES